MSIVAALALASLAQLTPATSNDASEDLALRITPEVIVTRNARPAVVSIQAQVPGVVRDIFGREFERTSTSSGTGVVIYDDGWVVTNNHVVRGADQIVVSLEPVIGEPPVEYPARLVSAVAEEDLALLKIEAPDDVRFSTVSLGTSSDLMIAEPVIAIGNPYGQTLTVSRGIISGLHRNVDIPTEGLRFSNLIQTDASINPGNSGGPLLNINGRLIGINTVVNRQAENIGFAIPVDRVRQVLEESLLAPSRAASWYGFEVATDPTAAGGEAVGGQGGFPVTAITPGGPAEAAGLAVGARILGWEDRRLESADAFRLERAALEPGRAVRFLVRDDDGERIVTMEGWSRDEGLIFDRAGLRTETVVLTSQMRRQWFTRVTAVRPDGPADALGLAPGDLIESFRAAGRQVLVPNSPQILALYLNSVEPGTRVDLDVWRDSNGNRVLDYTSQVSELLRGTLVLE